MKSYVKFGLAVAAVALLVPSLAQAEEGRMPGWYAGIEAFPSFQLNAKSKVLSDGVKNKSEYDAGWGLGGEVGYAFHNGFRVEGEASSRWSGDVNKVTGTNGTSTGGDIRNVAVMANGFYDFKTGTRFTPYIGAGVGVSVVDAFAMGTIDNRALDSERTQFAYQGIAGISTALDRNWALTVDYRYFRTTDPDFETNIGDRARTQNVSHNAVIGLRYTFGAPAPKAAPAPAPVPVAEPAVQAPAPAAAPVIPEVPQKFIVFFDFDRSTLTPEAKRIIAAAAEDYRKGKFVRIVVTGHTDTMGTSKYNQKLSIKRAFAVQAELNKQGVPVAAIDTKGEGKSSLLVPTADGVREAQNRRAEIVLNK
jgi:outer membrane protein OmpA-like peptidoglycan-associated protein